MFKSKIKLTAVGVVVVLAGFTTWLYWPQDKSPFDSQEVIKNAPQTAKAVIASSNKSKAADSETNNEPAKIRSIVKMPFDGASLVENEKGELMLVSANGRFAMMGTLIDTWKKEEISSAKQAAQAARHIPTEAIGLKPEGLNTFSVGSGKQRVSIFVDPQCHWCHKLVDEVVADDLLLENFVFDFYVVAALGESSDKLARHFLCADIKSSKKAALFAGAPKSFEGLKIKQNCSLDPYKQTLTAADLIGVRGVPFVIAPDGTFVSGKPRNLRKFLMKN